MMLSTSSRRWLLAGLCASALTVGACSRADKSVVEEITVDAASLDLSGADMEALQRHFALPPRAGSEADTLEALRRLGMATFTDGRTIDGSTVTFANWEASQGATTVTAESLTLRGVHLVGDGASYDALVGDAMTLGGQGVQGTVGEVVVVGPDATTAVELLQVLRGEESVASPTELSSAQGDAFRAVRLADVDLDVSEDQQQGTFSLGQLVFGEDESRGTLDVLVDSVTFDMGRVDTDARSTLRMDGLSAIGVRAQQDGAGGGVPGLGLLGSLGASAVLAPGGEPPFAQVDVGAFDFRSAGLDVDFAGFEADSAQQGGTLTLRSVLQPMTVSLKDAEGTPLAPYYSIMKENGLDVLSLKGSQTSTFDSRADRVSVSDARFEIDEGLRSVCDYTVEGMQEAARFMEDSGATQPDASNLQTEEDISAFLQQLEAFQTAQTEANGRIRIAALDCTVQDVADNSFVTRAYAVASDVTGMPVAVLKGQAKTFIAMRSLTAQDAFQRELMETVGTGLIEFLDTPGQTMRVRIAPDAPVALSTLRGDTPTLAPLNMTVTVE